ncbi:MAG: MBOAT family protein [Candidatus Hydrogenedens sp.]|nr:MBOAT family protein [Candidatus Hydrogenedens sp.]
MVFSSPTFLFAFLPLCLAVYLVLPRALKNSWLLVLSLIFYAWGEQQWVALMLLSIAGNYVFGMLVDRFRGNPRRAGAVIAATVVFNLGLLAWFKYANFLTDNLNSALGLAGLDPVVIEPVHLPIGISFFTFQAMSYVIDVYRGDGTVERNPLNLGLYIALFPQLIAGPIVRFQDIYEQLRERAVTLDGFAYGIQRFVIGLAKKVLIANVMALPADEIFNLPSSELTPALAWLGVVCYTFQIYFDFSGYSDMAIGLGHLFGFRFLENFRYPYVARSITDFWRRWHISLSTWFRDYLYIPLGGNRVSKRRNYLNLWLVFFLCGLWHGASWAFVVWGMYHGALLVLERVFLAGLLDRAGRPVQHAYTMLAFMIGWVFFRAETLPEAFAMLSAMAGFAAGDGTLHYTALYLNTEVALTLVIATIGATPVVPALQAAWSKRATSPGYEHLNGVAAIAVLGVVFIYTAVHLSASTYNPFIYFRF